MPRTLVVSGTTMRNWPQVRVWQRNHGHYMDVTGHWSWSNQPHQHYEVLALQGGSWWVPVSTTPPHVWGGETPVTGTQPTGVQPVNPYHVEFRPTGTYIWIPNGSIPGHLTPGGTSNTVVCQAPATYPPANAGAVLSLKQPPLATPHELLGSVLALADNEKPVFQDSDGLISFVNLSSSFVTSNPEFKTGRAVCDKVSNFFATLRIKVFKALKEHPEKVLPGDSVPTSQWSASVTHYMQFMLAQAGGLTNYRVTTETYSFTQVITEFNTAFLKLVFDAVTVPEAVITDVTAFISGVGKSLRASWDDRSRNYETAILAQCHEAVPTDSSGATTVYFPKIKYYYLSVDSSQQAFTSPCSSVEKITFNFRYEYYVTGLKASILDSESTDYKSFVAFLDRAQGISYKEATNNLDAILNDTTSPVASPALGTLLDAEQMLGVSLVEYPRTAGTPPRTIETLLNTRQAV
ncbi:hypothetical protein [Pseudomonas sp. FP198]|uniref:hypothetical protein n=1 Tax=Pseudomonas sp. FP198 TaxID=2954084 RepID=UPI002734E9F9|nr:hypothetical protein [Pseudomonas sp. FP198]WLG96648.1 hypothetical protein PSH78_04425 [Pseudomonas sp. FP198]